MGTHKRSWSGMNLVVFGSSPTIPMKIEQVLSQVSPTNEVRVESFENYEEALDYCKKQKSVGLIFILENCGPFLPKDVFEQLARPYRSRGLPAYGVLIHEKGESIFGLRTLRNNEDFLEYLPLNSLIDSKIATETMEKIWQNYIN